ncbi:MAG: DUF4157 domain-containing protein [Saprospiraceae bacterium]|nr:DUF4157 domain-containing protein [Saprospiraceae bacterium]
MKTTSTRRSRRHRNSHSGESEQQPFFSPAPAQAKAEQPFFQPKLAIGQPGDKYEQEADAVAEQVVGGRGQVPAVQKQSISAIQRTSLATPVEDEKLGTAEARMEKDKLVQEKPDVQREAASEEEEPVQMQTEEEEEPVQMKTEEEEEPVQMQTEEEEEPMQMKTEEEEPLQMQAEEEEEPVQMQAEEEEEPVQMQAEEEEEPLQMQAEEEEEPVQMQAEEEEEPVQMQAEEEEEPVQMQAEEEEEPVQMKVEPGAKTVSSRLGNRIHEKAGRGRPLPGKARSEMETAFGVDFGGVGIHTDTEAIQMNKTLGAQAFTHGRDVYFNSGKFRPESSQGKRLLAHELTHVVQQGGGSQKVPQVQGFFKKLGRKIKKAAKWVGGKVASGAKGVAKGFKWLGGKIAKGAKSVWKGLKWFGRKMWEKTLGIYHRIKRFITSFPARLRRLGNQLWEGVKSLKPWSLSWWKSLGKAATWKEFGYWLGEFAIYGLETLGIGEMYETLMDFVKFNTRPLTGAEIAVAKTVFGNSIDYNLVRVDERAILGPSWTKRAYVSFHTINNWGTVSPELLIHELTHVWQYQKMGAMYMPRAIHAQKAGGYNYGGIPALEANKNKGISAFNLEQQGDILEDYYKIKNGMTPSWGSGTAADLPLYEIYVNEVKKR